MGQVHWTVRARIVRLSGGTWWCGKNNDKTQDIDLLAIIDEPTLQPIPCASPDAQFTVGPYEVSLYSKSFWLQKLAAMDITMITCVYLPERFVLRPFNPSETQNLTWKSGDETQQQQRLELYQSVVSYAEYTWIKAKRVLDKWKDPYKSMKNVYFVFRILELGCQLLTHDRLVDLQAANHWYDEVCSIYEQQSIGPGDFDIVEAALARDFEMEVERFRSAATNDSHQPALTRQASEGVSVDCGICLNDLNGSPKGEKRSLRCGHSFHLDCIAEWTRCHELEEETRCPICRQSVCAQIDRKLAIRRELARRGIWRPLRFVGYPATIAVEAGSG